MAEILEPRGQLSRNAKGHRVATSNEGCRRGLDTLLNIRAFLTVARAGSFSAAARELGVAPSVVVKRINRLEDQMRAKLFVRSTRRMSLTEAGERARPRYHPAAGCSTISRQRRESSRKVSLAHPIAGLLDATTAG